MEMRRQPKKRSFVYDLLKYLEEKVNRGETIVTTKELYDKFINESDSYIRSAVAELLHKKVLDYVTRKNIKRKGYYAINRDRLKEAILIFERRNK